LSLNPRYGNADVLGGCEVLRDPTGRESLHDVIRLGSAFRPAASLVPDARVWGFARSTLWFRFEPRATGRGDWYLHAPWGVDRADVYYVSAGGRVARTTFGTLQPYDRRQLPAYSNKIVLPREATRSGTIYIRTVSREDLFGGFSIRPGAWEAGAGRALAEERLFPQLIVTGILGGLALFNMLLGLKLRERLYFWYAAAAGSFASFQFFECGAAWRWLWPGASVSYGLVTYVSYLLYFALIVVFAREFLRLPATQRKLWRGIVAIYLAMLIAELTYLIAPNLVDRSGLGGYIDLTASGFLLSAILWSGIVAWRAGRIGAGSYTIAFGGVVFGLVFGSLGNNAILAESSWTDAAPGLGVAWEAVFLALALAERIRQLRGERDALEVAAFYDGLTGIPNRRNFDRRLLEEWRRGLRGRTALGAILIDIDLFKSYNDAYGHPAGDRALRLVAGAIASSVRRTEDFVARYGGEEFIVLLPYSDLAGAAAVADSIRKAIMALGIGPPLEPAKRMTVSAGAASTIPGLGTTPEQLVAAADRALYDAKRAGRNRVGESAGLETGRAQK
jgi:diguanylate cyclase (GGDEF)-like protein